MVSTRHHPRAYPPPELGSETASVATTATTGSASTKSRSVRSKSKPRVSTSSKALATASSVSPGPESPTSPTSPGAGAVGRTRSSRRTGSSAWSHTPSHLTLIWLVVSLPLVIWDTAYVLLRPWTMPGGFLHKPLWTPYALYGTIDHVYGFPAFDARNGFTSAQGSLNVIESLFYIAYLYVIWINGREQESKTARGRSKKTLEGRGAPSKKLVGWLGEARVVAGRAAAIAVLIGFSGSIMTLSKTILYGLNEHFSAYKNVGHNSLRDLLFLYILPNGAWIVGSSYMTYTFGVEILEGLSIAGGAPVPRAIATKEE